MSEELISEKTFFIMKDSSVKTFYRAKINNHIVEIYVFNRNNAEGEAIINLDDVCEVYTSGTKKFDLALYKLINFISDDLIDNTHLRKFFVEVWNEFSDRIFDMQFENPSLPDEFRQYLDDLEKKYENPYIVSFFKEKYYFQKFKFVPYSKEWFKHHLANKAT